MDVHKARNELDDIQEQAWQGPESGEEHHKRLFDLFVAIEKVLPNLDGKNPGMEARADALTEAQTDIARTAARLEAHLIRDVLFKVALWRWLTPALDQPLEHLQVSDAVAYSAFRDLARILGEPAILTEFDLAR